MNIWPGVVLLVGIMLFILALTLPTIWRDLQRPPR